MSCRELASPSKLSAEAQAEMPLGLNVALTAHIFGIGKVFYRKRDGLIRRNTVSQAKVRQKMPVIIMQPVIVKARQNGFAR